MPGLIITDHDVPLILRSDSHSVVLATYCGNMSQCCRTHLPENGFPSAGIIISDAPAATRIRFRSLDLTIEYMKKVLKESQQRTLLTSSAKGVGSSSLQIKQEMRSDLIHKLMHLRRELKDFIRLCRTKL